MLPLHHVTVLKFDSISRQNRRGKNYIAAFSGAWECHDCDGRKGFLEKKFVGGPVGGRFGQSAFFWGGGLRRVKSRRKVPYDKIPTNVILEEFSRCIVKLARAVIDGSVVGKLAESMEPHYSAAHLMSR